MHLEIEKLDQRYGSARVLQNVSFAIDKGECCALLGRNGAGKTTLLRTIMGLMKVQGGNVVLNGNDITQSPAHQRARAGMGYVPQGREIFSELTVLQNLEIVMAANSVQNTEEIKGEVFSRFPVLADMSKRRGGDLSGGQQQQLAFARALATRPTFLILDEPTEGIQPSIVQVIQETIAGLKGQLTILLVEQYYEFARSLADTYVVLDRGEVVDAGRGEEMESREVERYLSV